MRVDDAFGNGQPEPGAAAIGAAGLPEPIEDPGQMVGRNAGPGVHHRKPNLVAVASRDHVDAAAGRRELDGVVQQITECLLNPISSACTSRSPDAISASSLY